MSNDRRPRLAAAGWSLPCLLFRAVSTLFLAVGMLGVLANVIETEPHMVKAAVALCLAGMFGMTLANITIASHRKKNTIAKMLLVTGVAVLWPWSMSLVYAAFVPPTDSNGNRPDDVVRNFIEFCEAEDHAAAEELYFGLSERVTPMTIEVFCARYKKIGLENCKICKAGRGKDGYWHVRIDFKEDGKNKHYSFYFKIIDGEWETHRGHAW